MNRSTPRHLLRYVTRRLRLRQYLEDPGDEPYGPGDCEYAAGQRLLRRVIGNVGKRFAQ